MPTPPLTREAINETFVCVLKSMFLTNTVRCMIEQEFMIKTSPKTLITGISNDSEKKRLIAGAHGNNYIKVKYGIIISILYIYLTN